MQLYIVVYQLSLYKLDIRGLGVAVSGELWCFPVLGCLLPRGYVARSGFCAGGVVFSLCGGRCMVFHAVEIPVLCGARRIFGREPRVLMCRFLVAYVLAYCFWFPMPWLRCF